MEHKVEEEEALSLQTRQFRHSNTAADTTTLLVNVSSTNGDGYENGISSLISSSNSSMNDHSETPEVGVSSPCGSPHKHSGDGDEDEERVHHLDSVYFEQHQGADSIDGVSDRKCGGVTCSVFEKIPGDVEVLVKNSEIQKSLIKDVNLQSRENSENEGLSSSSLTPLEGTFEEHNIKSKPSDSETIVVGDLDLIEETDQEVTELDVEKVLEKQNTHDLFCPNCNSCITRRVILRRRTKKILKARRIPKHSKSDTTLPSQSNANSTFSDANSADTANVPGHDIANTGSNDSPTPAVDEYNADGQPDVFRCLSCFSFFIPAGNGFKLFWVSSTNNENEQVPQKISTTNTNWFFSIFATHKRKTTSEQGNAAVDHTQVCGMNQDTSSGFPNTVSSPNGSNHSVTPHAERAKVKTGEHPEGLDNMGGTSLKAGTGIVISSRETKFAETALNSARRKSGDATENSGNDVIVTIEKEPLKHRDSEIVSVDSVEPTSLLTNINETNMGEQRGAGGGESLQWEIIKSIVYGGLIESITSLSVVSSAAGAGASNLNIIALGLANLIGGLFIIGHNLMDLKNDRSNQVNEQEDRYQETLGRRDNFPFHATVSILSFLVFGLLPPVMYGFLFLKSDDRDLKLAAVGGASLFCIILLAFGKASIQRKQPKPYISTALYFFSIGLMATGASYIAGDLISKLLQKISGFESNLLQELKPSEPATWASY
ncbi:MEMBRANE PROTEIN OF ER BODY-LIKE PROTEIN [Salix purpurea]|uniref:MEMBRANE PROTEIN OF ER BODY-LIKE PROTEIN n=1 Tax=Salix purpurea TaxID=77065 RepID=A0A9Q0W5E8_SALPP|nr:MEMBRANE PROTEIN OF ER BODY-LIKE PROTEIN [Salix purpurea]